MKFWDCAKVNMYVDNESEREKKIYLAVTAAAEMRQRPFNGVWVCGFIEAKCERALNEIRMFAIARTFHRNSVSQSTYKPIIFSKRNGEVVSREFSPFDILLGENDWI